jgi:uncharacterized membrane-anchored protein YhcB (DUF1043 family)
MWLMMLGLFEGIILGIIYMSAANAASKAELYMEIAEVTIEKNRLEEELRELIEKWSKEVESN